MNARKLVRDGVTKDQQQQFDHPAAFGNGGMNVKGRTLVGRAHLLAVLRSRIRRVMTQKGAARTLRSLDHLVEVAKSRSRASAGRTFHRMRGYSSSFEGGKDTRRQIAPGLWRSGKRIRQNPVNASQWQGPATAASRLTIRGQVEILKPLRQFRRGRAADSDSPGRTDKMGIDGGGCGF